MILNRIEFNIFVIILNYNMTIVEDNTRYMDIPNWYNISQYTERAHKCLSHRYGNSKKCANDQEFRFIAADILAYNHIYQFEKSRWKILNSSCEGHGEGDDKYLEAYKKKMRREFQSIKSHFLQLYNILKDKNESHINQRIKDTHDEIISM